jgi:hypothetical protein
MPENVLSPTDFAFTEDGELVVRAEPLRAALAGFGPAGTVATQQEDAAPRHDGESA